MKSFNIYNGGVKLLFGLNRVSELKTYLRDHERLLIITGRRSAKVSGALDDIVKVLDELGIEYDVYDRVKANPDTSIIRGIVETYRSENYDGFIAIGGGSVIDAAKAARVVVSGGGDIMDYLYHRRKVPSNQVFLLAVNLTHGTGSEIDRYSVVSVPEKKHKIGFSAGYPSVSLDDPKYTRTLPVNQTIYTSLDAFAHAVESSTSTLSSPYIILLSRDAVEKITTYLPKTLENPGNLEYRYWLLYASMIAGISIDHGVTHLGHGLEHVLSALNPDLPHGAGLAILYKVLIKIFYTYDPSTMSILLRPLHEELKPSREYSGEAQKAFNEFLEEIGFHETLSDYGFSRDDIALITRLFMEDPMYKRYHRLSPFKITSELVKEILENII